MPELTGQLHHTETGPHLDCRGCGRKVDTVFQITGARWLCAPCAFAATGQASFTGDNGKNLGVRIELPSGRVFRAERSIFAGLGEPDRLTVIEPPAGGSRLT